MSARKPAPDMGPTIERLRQIVAEAGDHLLLGDGPVHPDAKLLDLCAEALHHLRLAEKAQRSRSNSIYASWETLTAEERQSHTLEDNRLYHVYSDGIARAKPPLVLITKEKATTAAGVYAKALIVRASKTGAASLAMSLADDLVSTPALRRSIWPTETQACLITGPRG